MSIFYEYIKYILNSHGRYGFHSPFVYDFKDKCLSINLEERFLSNQKNQLELLKNHRKVIQITDFGAGSKRLLQQRKVTDIFRTATSKGIFLKMLSQITGYYQPKEILELGTSIGVGTFALTYGKGHVTTIEGCQNTQRVAIDNFPKESIENITFINDKFENYIQQDNKKYDLIFIDGHHDGKALIHYINLLEKNSHDETIFIFDDIRWSKGMLKAWKDIIQDSNFHLSLDLFKFGVVVKRHHQNKQHFVVKINHIIKSML